MLSVLVRLGLTAAFFVLAASCTAEEPGPDPAKGGQPAAGGNDTSGGVSAGGKSSAGGVQSSGGAKTYGGSQSSGGSKSYGGTTFDCENIQCFRAIECVEECGGPVLSSGCCPCGEGTFDSITCSNNGSGGSDGAGGAVGVAGSDALDGVE